MTTSQSPDNYSVIERTPGQRNQYNHGKFDSYSEALNWLANYNKQLHDTLMGTDVSAIVEGFFNYYTANAKEFRTVIIVPEGEEDE